MTDDEYLLPWVAGFFDGEGTLGVYKVKNLILWAAAISNTSLPALERVRKISGGNVYTRRKIPGRQQAWLLQLSSDRAAEFLRQIKPFSVVKRAQIDCWLEIRERYPISTTGGYPPDIEAEREQLMEHLKALKRTS